ncbi:hypothetical protein [Guptibacillus hwajinpoensis]|uniref:hypothetical protein n=1 Tax=Guptibacillus hwajinpoensis TaxID=208199 RepID=UPI00273E762A|nr:hypothetical protein [Pseudalkalibacillus hwajinpoensis]WLR60212.1 hypothetical protein LC071_02155 [Pseudalkalibacillus hwajinpoensis]
MSTIKSVFLIVFSSDHSQNDLAELLVMPIGLFSLLSIHHFFHFVPLNWYSLRSAFIFIAIFTIFYTFMKLIRKKLGTKNKKLSPYVIYMTYFVAILGGSVTMAS